MKKTWTADEVQALARGFHAPCVLAAAAELGVIGLLAKRPLKAEEAAAALGADARAAAVLLDALAALGLLEKWDGRYSPAAGAAEALSDAGPGSVLSVVRHLANCLRRWARLSEAVKTGQPSRCEPSILGEAADEASFIGAMDEISRSVADRLVYDLRLPEFERLLDVGGASGTWTFAFLKAFPKAGAVLFDRPSVVLMAERRIREAGLQGRVELASGDYNKDALPKGCDLAWLSAIAHQNSREQNRSLFRRVHAALEPRGRVLVRDVVMEESRTAPAMGALFAVNMLVATEGGSTFTFRELKDDLESAGFKAVEHLRKDEGMNSVVCAQKGGRA